MYICSAIASNIIEFGSTLCRDDTGYLVVSMKRIGAKTKRSRNMTIVELNV